MDKDEINKLFESLTLDDVTTSIHTPIASPGVGTYDIEWSISNIDIDTTYDIQPEESSPEVYTSHEQRIQHDKYPALQKAWEDYLNMYNLTKGSPPNVE
jgi:hypothetical protein